MKNMNILFILSDQQRFDTCGCYGQNLDVTPNLDKLASKGVLFSNAFTCQPVCGPARSCIQTGRYATETGCYINGMALPSEYRTIAHYFSEKKYDVGYIGKWHLASTIFRSKDISREKADYTILPIPPERRGGYKDFWLASDLLEFTSHSNKGHLFDADMNKVEFEGYRVDCLTDFALQFLHQRSQSKPLFLFISYLEPHQQNDHDQFEGPPGSKERFRNYKVPEDLVGLEGDWEEQFPDYLGSCNSIDQNVGRLHDTLGELGMLDNTIIFYTSDHACHFKTRNWEYKRSCHDSSIHVPLIIAGPGFQGGKKITELASLIDIAPTLLKAGKIKIPTYMKGMPLQDLLNGGKTEWRKEVFVQISETQVGRSIRTKKWKYSVKAPNKNGFRYSRSNLYEEDFLYDLESDSHERNNLVSDPDYTSTREMLKELLLKQMARAGETIPKIIPKSS